MAGLQLSPKIHKHLIGAPLVEYGARLADVAHHTLADIREWLALRGVQVSDNPIHKDRHAVLTAIQIDSAVARCLAAKSEELQAAVGRAVTNENLREVLVRLVGRVLVVDPPESQGMKKGG